jgi:hypothetical protein
VQKKKKNGEDGELSLLNRILVAFDAWNLIFRSSALIMQPSLLSPFFDEVLPFLLNPILLTS